MACEHCPSRPLCACPYGPAKCLAGACECESHCPCRVEYESSNEPLKPRPKRRPPEILCGPFGLLLLVAVVVMGVVTSILWWDDTPLVGLALLAILATFVVWTVMMTAFFGRWGTEVFGVVPHPKWLWVLLLLLSVVSLALGMAALFDGAETRAAVLLLIVATMAARLAFFGHWILLAAWRGVMFPLMIALVGIVLVVGLIAVIDADRTFAPWLVMLAILPALLVMVLPMIFGRTQLGELAPIAGPFPAALWLMPILTFIVSVVMALSAGLIPSDPHGGTVSPAPAPGSAEDPNSGGSEGDDDSQQDPPENDPTPENDPAPEDDRGQTQTTDDEEPDEQLQEAPNQQTYRLAMSNGESFPIYRLEFDGGSPLVIVLPNPDPCWVLQYDAGVAAQLGECSEQWVGDVVPDPAVILYRNDTSVVVGLTFEDQLVVTDFGALQGQTTAMGFEGGLANQFFVTLTPVGNILVIGNETFQR